MDASRDLEERLVSLTRDLILIPSTAARPEEREQCFAFIRNHIEPLEHIVIQEIRCEGWPSLLVLPEGVDEPEVLICGHLDVICHPDVAVYRSRVEDGRIYGPGAGDMKGPLAILLEIFREFHSRHEKASLGLLITSDEEIGGQCGVRHLFEDLGFRCGAAMIPDGGSLTEITVEEKGVIHARAHCHGHAAHAARPWLGCNALERLMDGLGRVRQHFDALQKEGGAWAPTCSLSYVSTPNTTPNRVPAEAEAVLDMRFPPPYTVEGMASSVREALGEQIDLTTLLSADPVHLSPDPMYREVTEEVMGQPASLVKEPGGSDGRFICIYGIPVMMSRPLVGEVHAEDEWIDIASMTTFYRIYETYLERRFAQNGA